jgi:predicted DNA-binding transcriptional regulator AlpA
MNTSEDVTIQNVDPRALLRLPQVLRLVPVGASSWWAGIRRGDYPRGIKLGKRTTVWKASDILALIERATASGDPR